MSLRLLRWLPLLLALLALVPVTVAHPPPFERGDVFVGIGNGQVAQYRPTGTLVHTLDTTSGSAEQAGMCVEPSSGDLFATDFSAGVMTRFNDVGSIKSHPWGGPFSAHPTGCAFDAAGNLYTSEADGRNFIRKWSPSGTLLGIWAPATTGAGITALDLAADQCTLYYTVGAATVQAFNACTNTQLPNVIDTLPGPCATLRLLADGTDLLVACADGVWRLTRQGEIVQVYPKAAQETSYLAALALDPDGQTFWTAGYSTGTVYRYRLATGTLVGQFTVPPLSRGISSLTVYAQGPASTPTPTGTEWSSATATNSPPSVTATPPLCSAVWSRVASPNAADSTILRSVAGATANDLWAVGYSGTAGGYQTAALHWTGSSWTLIATPNAGMGNNYFSAVAAISPTDVWAAGNFDPVPADTTTTLLAHWDGTAWTLDPNPVPGTLSGLTAVAANNVWAVGYLGESGDYHTFIRHWDGSNWSTVASPDGGVGANYLTALAGSSATDLWAVGYRETATAQQTVTLHWNGTIWTLDPTASAGVLHAVTSRSPSDVWAVGLAGQPATTLTRHWEGSGWTSVPGPSGGPGANYLRGVTTLPGSAVWAVGATEPSSGPAQPLVSQWTGQNWTVDPPPAAGVLQAITGIEPQDLWAVGYGGTLEAAQTLIIHGQIQCATLTPTASPTGTPTPTNTPSPSPTGTPIATNTPPPSPTDTPIATNTPPPSPTGTPTPIACVRPTFSDVPPEYWAAGYIRWLYCRGAISGYSDGTFRPEGTVTRGQTAKIVLLGAGIAPALPPGAPHFRDVPPTDVFYPFIETAYGRGILSGYSDGTFQPSAAVSRGQIAKIVVGTRGLVPVGPSTATFADVPPSDTFYRAIETATAYGIVSGYDCGTVTTEPCDAGRRPYYRPSAHATRAQLSKVTYLAFGLALR